MQEILVLIAVALAIFYLPRVLGKRPPPARVIRRPPLTGWMRLAILVTLFWIMGFALFLKPWQDGLLPFLSAGLGPVAALWGAAWVWVGCKRCRR